MSNEIEEDTKKFIDFNTITNSNNKYTMGDKHKVQEENKYKKRQKTCLEKLQHILFNILCWIETKLFALFSIILGCYLTYYSNFFKVLYEHSKIDSGYFYSSLLFYSIAVCIMLYLCLYLPYFKNIQDDKWDEYCPNMIPIATFCGVMGMIVLIACVWDVWGWYSIPLILLIKWGFIMTVHFAPGGTLGSAVFIILLVALLVSGFYIEHEGYLH